MKYGQFVLGLLVGALAAHLWHRKDWAKPADIKEKLYTEENTANYSDPLKKKYDIKMPSDLISKKLRKKGEQFTEGRYEVDLMKIKQPVNI
jgi:hypothetical protein